MVLLAGLLLMTMAGTSPCPCPAAPSTALDLDWATTDANGFPINPWWLSQTTSNACVDPASDCLCAGFPVKGGVPFGKPQCADQTVEDVPHGVHKLTCMLEWFHDKRRGVTRGHINWYPVVLTGHAWFDHQGGADNDVNFELVPDSKAPTGGVPGQTVWNKDAGELSRPDSLHVEMKKSETISRLSQKWWKDLADAKTPQARKMVEGARAVAVGLFGLDAEHKGHSELHPAYALAFRTACRASGKKVEETWALFMRNYGNEGWCSRWDEYHHLPLNNQALVLQLPLLPTAKKVTFTKAPLLLSNRKGIKAALLSSSGRSADVQLAWPALGAADVLRVHGEVTLSFETTGPVGDHCTNPPSLPIQEVAGSDEGEELIDELARRATPRVPEGLRDMEGSDIEPVLVELVATTPIERKGPCPGGVATCDEMLRARARDAFFAVPALEGMAEAAFTRQVDDGLCKAAREMLAEQESRARGTRVDDEEGLQLRRLETLVAMCEVEEGGQ